MKDISLKYNFNYKPCIIIFIKIFKAKKYGTNIVLGNGGKTLFNGYLIDQFTGEFDNSAYTDNFELWINEISFIWTQILAEQIIEGGIPG